MLGGHLQIFTCLSNIYMYLKNVNNQRFNQSNHDIKFWYGRTAASIEWLVSFKGACSPASMVEAQGSKLTKSLSRHLATEW